MLLDRSAAARGKSALLDMIRSARDLAVLVGYDVQAFTAGAGTRREAVGTCACARRHLRDARALAAQLERQSAGDTRVAYADARSRLDEALDALDAVEVQVERRRFRRTEWMAKACAACCRLGYLLLAADETVDAVDDDKSVNDLLMAS